MSFPNLSSGQQTCSSPSTPDGMFGDINAKNSPINFQYPPKSLTPNPSQPSFKKTKWTPEEDKLLIDSVTKNGMTNWSLVAKEVPGRNGKQCRERWANQLCPELTKENWTPQEDEILKKQQAIYGNLWAKIARYLPGRSANSVKNRWSWLMRHQPSLQVPFSSPMVPFFMQQFQQMQMNSIQQKPRNIPPIPQINQVQQTCPTEASFGTGSASGSFHFASSEPTIYVPPASGASMNDLTSFEENEGRDFGMPSTTIFDDSFLGQDNSNPNQFDILDPVDSLFNESPFW